MVRVTGPTFHYGDIENAQTIVLVDLGHLLTRINELIKILDISNPEFDLSSFLNNVRRSHFAHCFIYYAFDSKTETPENTKNTAHSDKLPLVDLTEDVFLSVIQKIPNCVARLGNITSGRKRTQKGVDVMLAVDMLKKTHAGTCRRIILVTGDQDFLPAVNACIEVGVAVEVIGLQKTTSKLLLQESSTSLTIDDYHLLRYILPPHETLNKIVCDASELNSLQLVEEFEFESQKYPILIDTDFTYYAKISDTNLFTSNQLKYLKNWIKSIANH